jgi:hypothetical protein
MGQQMEAGTQMGHQMGAAAQMGAAVQMGSQMVPQMGVAAQLMAPGIGGEGKSQEDSPEMRSAPKMAAGFNFSDDGPPSQDVFPDLSLGKVLAAKEPIFFSEPPAAAPIAAAELRAAAAEIGDIPGDKEEVMMSIVQGAEERMKQRRQGGAAAKPAEAEMPGETWEAALAGELDAPRLRRPTEPKGGDMKDIAAQQEMADDEIITYKDMVSVREAGKLGRGLFAKKDINAGDLTLRYYGDIYNSREDAEKGRIAKNHLPGYLFEARGDDGRPIFIDGGGVEQLARRVNHRGEPDLQFIATKYLTDFPTLELVKDVKKDDQIFGDYGSDYDYKERGIGER